MATPRKHWFRVADSVLHETWSNEELGALVRLMAYLNTRWARNGLDAEAACQATIPAMALCQIMGRKRFDSAVVLLQKLTGISSVLAQYSDDSATITWRKYAEYQGLAPRESPPPQPPPQDAPARRKTHKKDPAPTEPSACNSCGCEHPKKKHRMPDPLSIHQLAALERWGAETGRDARVIGHALETIREWADGKGALNLCWVRAIQGYIREGWALRGMPGHTGPNGRAAPAPARPAPLTYGSREWCAAQSPPIDFETFHGGRH